MKMSMPRVLWLIIKGEKFNPLLFALTLDKDYGGISYNTVGPVTMYQISDPELIHEILVDKADKFHKAERIRHALEPFAGNGLLLSEGDFWKRQRKLAQPAFHTKRIDSYAQTMVDFTVQMLDRWHNNEVRYIDREMMQLTLKIVCKTLFDADVSGDAERVGVLLTEVLEESNEKVTTAFELPEWIPSAKRAHRKAMLAELDTLIHRFIEDRKRLGEDKGDLLSMLLEARDDDGSGMDPKQLRDETMTLFIAGHETTAMALSWAWYLLATHPETMQKLHHEVDTALQGRLPTLRDLANLPYTDMVLKEAMRLYPPAPGVSRQATEDVQIGDYLIEKDVMVSLSFYAMHRSARYFENPEMFNPERFSKENEANIPRYAYLPFSSGPRVCIGNMFAIMEARLILAAIAQRYDLELEAGQAIVAEQLLTIRPKHGIRMRLKQRETVPAGNLV
jgi:cytochrome P450